MADEKSYGKFYSDKIISKEGEMVSQLESLKKIQKLFMEAREDECQTAGCRE